MTNAIKDALESLYSLHKEYDDFAAAAPLHYDRATDEKIDEYDAKFDAAEEQVFNLAKTIDDEYEALSVLSLLTSWYRIPRYLERHAA